MFQFKALELMNWDFWPHFEIPFDERIIMLAGPNGSGKTTFLDSLRMLLGAKTLSTGRKISKYLRSSDRVAMIKGVVTNQLRHGKRPFRNLGYSTEDVTLVCLLENKGGAWEKKFAIIPGNYNTEEIQKWDKWFGPEEYSKQLHAAGLPRTLLKILALEQGETNKLCQKSPVELLKYLLEIQGDKITLDRYSEALENYRASDKELFGQTQKSVTMERNLIDHEKKASEADGYHSRVAELDSLRAITLPKAIYKDIKNRSDELQTQIGTEENKLKALRDTRDGIDDELARILSDDKQTVAEIVTIRDVSKKYAKEKERYDLEYGGISRELENFDKLRNEVSEIVAEDGEVLSKRLEESRRAAARYANSADEAHEKFTALVQEGRELENQKGVTFPREVNEIRRALEQENIEHALVAEQVEVKDSEWQLAVESTLGNSRFTLVVNRRDTLRAREIARLKKYRYFVSEFEDKPYRDAASAHTALSVTEFGRADLPHWIYENLGRVRLVNDVAEGLKLGKSTTSMTRDGYRQDFRGGAFAGVDRLYCGRSAASERLRVIQQQELPQATNNRDTFMNERDAAERLVNELTVRLTRQRKLAEWREKEALLSEKLDRQKELMGIRRGMTDKIVDNDMRLSTFEHLKNERAVKRGELTARRERIEQERAYLERNIPQQRARAISELDQLSRLEQQLPEEQRTPEALETVPTRESTEALIKRLDHEVSDWTGCRDLTAKEVYEKIKAEYDEFNGFLGARRNEHVRWSEELSLARKSYKRVVDQTVEFYRKAVTRLAEKAGFQIDLPAIVMNEEDDLIERAGLIVRVAYDGKRFVNIDDPDLSGGQSVLTSLVLLLGMTFADGGEDSSGFFILDEPFAHLSVERIDDVAAFLSATKSQFILTTPTTHNHNVFNPAHLTVALRKKRPGEISAPAPVFIRK